VKIAYFTVAEVTQVNEGLYRVRQLLKADTVLKAPESKPATKAEFAPAKEIKFVPTI
jgi:hypothetical protein